MIRLVFYPLKHAVCPEEKKRNDELEKERKKNAEAEEVRLKEEQEKQAKALREKQEKEEAQRKVAEGSQLVFIDRKFVSRVATTTMIDHLFMILTAG